MTVTMNLDEFLNTLNQLIESANGCLQDPKSFLAANAEIGELIEAVLPALSEMFGQDEPDPEIRARLADSLSAVRDLEAKANARLAWSRDFEDHMRNALVGER